jgi:hypothetical protein
MKKLLLILLTFAAALAPLGAQVIGVQPEPLGVYTWDPTATQYDKVTNSYALFGLQNTPQPIAFYGWNASLGEWTPCTNGGSCPNPFASSGTSVTWPSTGDIVISNNSNSPAGLAPVNGECAIGSAGAWSVGACGGGGGGGSLIPSNAVFIFTGDSKNDDDNHDLSTGVAMSSWSTTSGVTTIQATAHGFTAGQWINMRFATSWPTNATYELGTGYTLFQVQSAGLTANQFEIDTSLISAGNCASSCGDVYNAMGYLPFVTTSQPAFPSGSVNRTYMFLSTDVTIRGLNQNFTTMFASSGTPITCPVSVPTYLIIHDFTNDVGIGRTYEQIESDYQSAWAKAHTCGMTVVADSASPYNFDQQSIGAVYNNLFFTQDWLTAQGKSPATASSGEYWDIGADGGTAVADFEDPNLFNSGNNGLVAGGVYKIATSIANAMATGSGIIHPSTGPIWGTVADTEATEANGYAYRPSADEAFTYQWLNAAATARAMYLRTDSNPFTLGLGFGSSNPGAIVVNGDPETSSNFQPVGQFIDQNGYFFNSSIKTLTVGSPVTPGSGDNSNHNIIETIGAFGAFLNSGITIPTSGAVDLAFGYNSTSTFNSNFFFTHIANDTYDELRTCYNGNVAFRIPTAETSGNPVGCPAYALSLGWTGSGTPPWTVDSSGDQVVANLDVTGSCTGCGGGGYSPAAPYWSSGSTKVTDLGYQATLPSQSPTWLGSVAPATTTWGANGDGYFQTASVNWASQAATTSATVVMRGFSEQGYGGDTSPFLGAWIWDSTNGVIYVIKDAFSSPSGSSTVNYYCASHASYSGSGSPGSLSDFTAPCLAGGIFGWSNEAYFRVTVSGSNVLYQFSLNGGQNWTTFYTETPGSLGTITAGGYVLGGAAGPTDYDVLSVATN